MTHVLETPRLRLRRLTLADVANLQRIFADPVAMRYYPGVKDEAETVAWIERAERSYEEHGWGLWAAVAKDDGRFVGQAGLVRQEVAGNLETEIGYLFVRTEWNRGLATEAAAACRDFGFQAAGLRRLVALIDPANLASRRVAEKIGMRHERDAPMWGKTVCVYAIQDDR